MKRMRFVKQLAAAAGLLLVSAIPDRTCGQALPPAGGIPPKTMPAARPKKAPDPMDDFAGLSFNEEQKAKIQQIRQDIKSRMDVVKKDDKLTADQKEAMLFGFQRMERSQVFEVLTPEQQSEVRKRIQARHKAEKQQSQRPQPPSGR